MSTSRYFPMHNLRHKMVSHIILYLPFIAKSSYICSTSLYLNSFLHPSFLLKPVFTIKSQSQSNGFKIGLLSWIFIRLIVAILYSRRVTRACYEHSRRLLLKRINPRWPFTCSCLISFITRRFWN